MNVSIDDTFSEPSSDARIYYGLTNQLVTGDTGWSIGPNCSTCLAQPDPSLAFDRSWHDTSTGGKQGNIPYASASFTGEQQFSRSKVQLEDMKCIISKGVAVYVMGIIISSIPQTNNALNNSRMSFQIDGINQTSFYHIASVGPEVVFSYNTTFFAKENLPDGFHNITIMCGDGNQTIGSNCLLDRIIYTWVSLISLLVTLIELSFMHLFFVLGPKPAPPLDSTPLILVSPCTSVPA